MIRKNKLILAKKRKIFENLKNQIRQNPDIDSEIQKELALKQQITDLQKEYQTNFQLKMLLEKEEKKKHYKDVSGIIKRRRGNSMIIKKNQVENESQKN